MSKEEKEYEVLKRKLLSVLDEMRGMWGDVIDTIEDEFQMFKLLKEVKRHEAKKRR